MTYFQNGQSQGWTCPNCGNGLVTSYIDDMQLDENIYTVTLLPNSNPSTTELKIVSKISGLNILDSKALVLEGGELIKGRADKISDSINHLNSVGLSIKICPKYPYVN